MSDNWSGPLADPPFWLNPERELTSAAEPPKLSKTGFVVRCVEALLSEGCNIEQAIDVTANSVGETAWGQKYRGYNLGGVKANKHNTSFNEFWWRALGHKQSGDGQTCFYKGFGSIEIFFEYWLSRFVPKTGDGRYAKTGQQFWAGEPWFDDLIAAGYKGEVTKMHPEESIEAHGDIAETVGKMWVQHKLGIKVDGVWGPVSRAAVEAFQDRHQLDGSRDVLWFLASGHPAPVKPAIYAPPPPPPPPTSSASSATPPADVIETDEGAKENGPAAASGAPKGAPKTAPKPTPAKP